jgi:YD repeat-containing protein
MRNSFNARKPFFPNRRRVRQVAGAYLCWVLVLAALPACRRDRETDPKLCVLTEVRGLAGEVLERFEYDPAGQLVKYTLDGFQYRLRYNEAGQLAGVTESGLNLDGQEFEREITLQYADGGKTVLVTKPSDAARPYAYTITLDGQGQLLRYAGDEDGRQSAWRYEYNEAGDVVRGFSTQDGPEHLAYDQESFDGKPSPYYTPESLRMFMQLVFGKAISRHNPIVTRHYNPEGSAVDWTRTDVYTYNDRGYLVGQQGDFAGYDYTVTYGYTCR